MNEKYSSVLFHLIDLYSLLDYTKNSYYLFSVEVNR